jgi:hypothetical protein
MLGGGDEVRQECGRWPSGGRLAVVSLAAAGEQDEAALGGLGRRIPGLSRRGALAAAPCGWKSADVHRDASPVPKRDTEVSHKLSIARDGPFSGWMALPQGSIA